MSAVPGWAGVCLGTGLHGWNVSAEPERDERERCEDCRCGAPPVDLALLADLDELVGGRCGHVGFESAPFRLAPEMIGSPADDRLPHSPAGPLGRDRSSDFGSSVDCDQLGSGRRRARQHRSTPSSSKWPRGLSAAHRCASAEGAVSPIGHVRSALSGAYCLPTTLTLVVGLALWAITWILPLTFMIAMAWGCESQTRALGRRALAFYGGEASTTNAAIAVAGKNQDRGAQHAPDRAQRRARVLGGHPGRVRRIRQSRPPLDGPHLARRAGITRRPLPRDRNGGVGSRR